MIMLKLNRKILLFVGLLLTVQAFASNDSLRYNAEIFASVAYQDRTPTWIVNGNYGLVPLEANNAYLRGGAFWKHHFNSDFRLDAGIDLALVSGRSPAFLAQQLYAGISFKALNLTVGSKENYHSMLDKYLSSGDFSFSTNARPIPEINISIPDFVYVPLTKNILQFKGDFAVGKFLDNDYTMGQKSPSPQAIYAVDVLLHHKSAFFLLEDPEEKFPVYLLLGLEDCAQWGGWTNYHNYGELPHSFKDFWKVVFGSSGGEDAPDSEMINRLGNHLGTYNFKIGYKHPLFNLAAYKQHYFEDNSGLEFANWADGNWGLECSLLKSFYLNKIVFEYINTTNQSGTMHWLQEAQPARGGGADNYFNNGIYTNGWAYWGRAIGNPLIPSPEYNEKGKLGFLNNRVKAHHLGLSGNIVDGLTYRLLATWTNSWGTMNRPLLDKQNSFSGLAECQYGPSKWKGWKLGLQLAGDKGTMYGNNIGASIRISKSGLLLP